VSEIMVEAAVFRTGDTLLIEGSATGVIEQVAESMEIQHEKADVARKGQAIALKTARPARKNDRVYVLRARAMKG
jgi:hypothetical protein